VKLKNCPFCGGKAKYDKGSPNIPGRFVKCLNCGAKIETETSLCLDIWNKRVTDIDAAFEKAKKETLYIEKDVIPLKGESLEGRTLVLKPSSLAKNYRTRENQLWVAVGGFGCDPNAIGQAVFAKSPTDGATDGETVRWSRSSFMGILK
jgi:hypothetical protein